MRAQVLLKEHSIIKSGVRVLRPSEYKELRASVQKRGKQVLMDCLLLSRMRYEEVLRLRHNPDFLVNFYTVQALSRWPRFDFDAFIAEVEKAVNDNSDDISASTFSVFKQWFKDYYEQEEKRPNLLMKARKELQEKVEMNARIRTGGSTDITATAPFIEVNYGPDGSVEVGDAVELTREEIQEEIEEQKDLPHSLGFDAIAVSEDIWHGVQATEEGHASDRRHKVDVGFPTQPPNTVVDVWEYIFRRDEKDARKLVYRINLSRRFNLGTRDAPALEWFLLKDGKWKHVAVRGDERSNGILQGRGQGVIASMRYVPKAAHGWVHMNADDHASSKDGSALGTETSPGVPGETGIGKVVR